jgi:hypothetical protein
MSHKTKYFFFLILCFAIIGVGSTTFTQTRDEVLVSKSGATLRRSDIDKMIEFYEWAFETRFSSEQRSKFSEYTVREFSSDPAKYRKTVDDIVGTFAKISSGDENTQARTRNSFLPAFLSELRNGQDENSQLLLSIYETEHNTNSSSLAQSNKADSSTSAVGNISSLAGTWVWGHSGSSTYSTGGSYMGSNGSRHTYKFLPDGSAEYTGIMNVMTGGCNMQVFRTMKGRASLNGSTLTINWSPGPFSRDDSCDRAGNYKKTMPAETETFQVRFKDDLGQRQLCMTGKSETCYSPSN